ncbi:MAG: PleD family two-component system response regulator [Synechococcus sp.]
MTKTIVVIDDDAAIATLIVKLLQSKGYEAIGFNDPVEGLKQIEDLLPELVICDVVMPSMSGYELLQVLQDSPSTASIPLMFLTSKTARKDVLEGITLGADNYLSKPINAEEVLAAVATRFAELDSQSSAESTPKSGLAIPLQLQAEYSGWWAAVEPASNRYFLGKTREQAYQAALRAYPSGIFLYQELNSATPVDVAVA